MTVVASGRRFVTSISPVEVHPLRRLRAPRGGLRLAAGDGFGEVRADFDGRAEVDLALAAGGGVGHPALGEDRVRPVLPGPVQQRRGGREGGVGRVFEDDRVRDGPLRQQLRQLFLLVRVPNQFPRRDGGEQGGVFIFVGDGEVLHPHRHPLAAGERHVGDGVDVEVFVAAPLADGRGGGIGGGGLHHLRGEEATLRLCLDRVGKVLPASAQLHRRFVGDLQADRVGLALEGEARHADDEVHAGGGQVDQVVHQRRLQRDLGLAVVAQRDAVLRHPLEPGLDVAQPGRDFSGHVAAAVRDDAEGEAGADGVVLDRVRHGALAAEQGELGDRPDRHGPHAGVGFEQERRAALREQGLAGVGVLPGPAAFFGRAGRAGEDRGLVGGEFGVLAPVLVDEDAAADGGGQQFLGRQRRPLDGDGLVPGGGARQLRPVAVHAGPERPEQRLRQPGDPRRAVRHGQHALADD